LAVPCPVGPNGASARRRARARPSFDERRKQLVTFIGRSKPGNGSTARPHAKRSVSGRSSAGRNGGAGMRNALRLGSANTLHVCSFTLNASNNERNANAGMRKWREIERVVWLVHKHERHAALALLPHPFQRCHRKPVIRWPPGLSPSHLRPYLPVRG